MGTFEGGSPCLRAESRLLINIVMYINQSINQSMAFSASCAGHTRTQSHAALYKINNEVVRSGMVASYYKRGSE